MNYDTLYTIATSPEMLSRVTIAVIRTAIAIRKEKHEDFSNHSLRDILARQVLNNPEQMARTFSLLVVVNDSVISKTIGAGKGTLEGVSDAEFESAVADVWDALL